MNESKIEARGRSLSRSRSLNGGGDSGAEEPIAVKVGVSAPSVPYEFS